MRARPAGRLRARGRERRPGAAGRAQLDRPAAMPEVASATTARTSVGSSGSGASNATVSGGVRSTRTTPPLARTRCRRRRSPGSGPRGGRRRRSATVASSPPAAASAPASICQRTDATPERPGRRGRGAPTVTGVATSAHPPGRRTASIDGRGAVDADERAHRGGRDAGAGDRADLDRRRALGQPSSGRLVATTASRPPSARGSPDPGRRRRAVRRERQRRVAAQPGSAAERSGAPGGRVVEAQRHRRGRRADVARRVLERDADRVLARAGRHGTAARRRAATADRRRDRCGAPPPRGRPSAARARPARPAPPGSATRSVRRTRDAPGGAAVQRDRRLGRRRVVDAHDPLAPRPGPAGVLHPEPQPVHAVGPGPACRTTRGRAARARHRPGEVARRA